MGKTHSMSASKKVNKIIPMPLDANFFFERAIHHLHRNDLSKALKYFWKIIEMESKNPVHYCNLAGLLTEMGRYKESNELLLYVVNKLDSNLGECYYFIANNYAYLEEIELTYKYIHRYLEMEPHGEYAEEANELLAFITPDMDEFDEEAGDVDKEVLILHYKAKILLEEGNFYDAIKGLKKMIADNPDFLAARNNLALAYFYIGNYKKAIEQANYVLEKDTTNIHAMCNLAIFYQHLNEEKNFRFLLDSLRKIYPFKIEQTYKIATTFAILGEDDLAFLHLKKLVKDEENSNPTLMHYGAVAAFNTKNYAIAERLWRKIQKLDGYNEVANFYLDMIQQLSQKEHTITLPNYCYQYELPIEQQLSSLQAYSSPEEEFTIHSLEWGLRVGNEKLKEQIILALAAINNKRAEEILREFLLDDMQIYKLKKKVLLALEEMNAIPPYDVVINGKGFKMNRQTPDISLWKDQWLEVLASIEKLLGETYHIIELYDAKTIWFDFISKTYPKTPQIRKTESWVAALEFLVAKMHKKPISITRLAKKYDITKQTLLKHINQFEEVLQLNKKMNNHYPLK